MMWSWTATCSLCSGVRWGANLLLCSLYSDNRHGAELPFYSLCSGVWCGAELPHSPLCSGVYMMWSWTTILFPLFRCMMWSWTTTLSPLFRCMMWSWTTTMCRGRQVLHNSPQQSNSPQKAPDSGVQHSSQKGVSVFHGRHRLMYSYLLYLYVHKIIHTKFIAFCALKNYKLIFSECLIQTW